MEDFLQRIAIYFMNDPMKILYLLGGSGGIYFWYEKWANRVRVKIILEKQEYDPSGNFSASLKFRCINIGSRLTSLQDSIKVHCFTNTGASFIQSLPVQSTDLILKPHESKSLLALGPANPSYYFSNFRKYKFFTNSGNTILIHTTSSSIESRVSRFKWIVERIKLSLKRWLRSKILNIEST